MTVFAGWARCEKYYLYKKADEQGRGSAQGDGNEDQSKYSDTNIFRPDSGSKRGNELKKMKRKRNTQTDGVSIPFIIRQREFSMVC